jgi:hypothetical protein
LLGSAPARADFCLNLIVSADVSDSYFFHFLKKYQTKPDKITALTGRVIIVDEGAVIGRGPAYGSELGLPPSHFGNSLGVTFMIGENTVNHATVVLDANGMMTGTGRVILADGTVRSVVGDIVDGLTEPS